jgi:beta-barrel assembly-enhancing protease
MKTYISIALFFLFSGIVSAQNTADYKPLVSEGSIPKEFITPSSAKYKSDIDKINTKAKTKEKKTRKQFALETNFVLDDILQSGRVVFNDKITAYLNQVATGLVQKEDSKLSKLKIYTLRSSAVNAFATGRGEVFVTLGLLAQLENEAQLAFILSHELTHIQEQHSLELYLEANGIGKNSSNRDILKNSRLSDKFLAKHNYKKELETEADEKGLQRFLKTKYSSATLNDVFDILKYAYLPFDEVAFEHSVFQNESYKIPETYRLEKVKPINVEKEEKDDAESTHPNISKRKAAMTSVLKDAKNEGKSDFIVSKEIFTEIQQIARYELPLLYLKAEQYPNAVYTSFLLLKKNPTSLYAKKCLAKGLYYQAKFKNDKDYSYSSIYDKIEGESQQIHYLLEKMPAKEIAILAMRYAWQVRQLSPKDSEMKRLTEDLAITLAENDLKLSEFKSMSDIKTAKETPSLKPSPKDTAAMSKLDKIRNQEGKTVATNENYWQFGFAEFTTDTAFAAALKVGQDEHKDRKEMQAYFETEKGRRLWEKEEKMNKKNGYRLGIDKVVVINPYYMKIDERKATDVDYINTETGQEHLKDMIKLVSTKTNLKVDILDINSLTDKQVNQFNDLRYLNEWFSEQVDKYNLTLTPGTQQGIVDSIAKKYGTDYFLWTGVISLRQKKHGIGWMVFGSIVYPIIIPYTAYLIAKPEYDMMHYAILYDVKTGRRQTLKFDYFDSKDTDALVKSHYYDTFMQIATKDNSRGKKKGKK